MRQQNKQSVSLGQVLTEVGIITRTQFEEAWAAAGGQENQLAQQLIDLKFVTEEQIVKGIGIKDTIPYFPDLHALLADDAAQLLPEKLSRQYQVAPLFRDGDDLLLAILNPYDIFTLDAIAQYTGAEIKPVVSTRAAIFDAVAHIYRSGGTKTMTTDISRAVQDIRGNEEADAAEPDEFFHVAGEDASLGIDTKGIAAELLKLRGLNISSPQAEDAPLIKLVNRIINEAIKSLATDIHIESESRRLTVRYRIDGILYRVLELPLDLGPAILSRTKIMSRLDISETRLPQDGHIQFGYIDRVVDLRVSTVPTVTGEKVTIRILDRSNLIMDLERLGFDEAMVATFQRNMAIPNGIFLVTGPTGSGKTTTLYAMLMTLNDKTRNISTLEDPVEYQVDGLNQIQMVPRIGLTFARGLRSLLRQDPDIILVGEIRDQETADIAIHSALTGHFILSTLHTNSAVGTIARFMSMGIEPYLINSSVRGILSQRLVRRICSQCREEYVPEPEVAAALGLDEGGGIFRGAGCASCNESGYSGRTTIYEFLSLTRPLQDAINNMANVHELAAIAKKEGFLDLYGEGLEKVRSGQTTIEEVERIIGRRVGTS